MKQQQHSLKRSLSLPLITFYGLGNILGAGIYVLVGKVAGEAGYFAPLAFFIASIIAAISAFTYAELSARYPVSAGVAAYVYEAFHIRPLALLVGVLISLAGIVSSAAIAHGFAGYVQVFVHWPDWLIITLALFTLGMLAIWGISESLTVAALLTVIEIAGLLLIVWVGAEYVVEIPQRLDEQSVSLGVIPWLGVFSGAFLAFYAYLGFEDMVNVAEEAVVPERNMPRAILLSVVISTLLYAAVVVVAVLVMSPQQLAQSDAPLADVYMTATGKTPIVISFIGMFAVINGTLIQIVMSSRMLYGMASRGWLPEFLTYVNPVTRTPVNSTLLVVALVLLFALLLPLVTLAELTSFLVLMVFSLVNLALLRIKKSQPAPKAVKVYSKWVPVAGFVSAFAFLLIEISSKV